jgi:hypothetical protein
VSQTGAALMAIAAFVMFGGAAAALFAALDVRMLFLPGLPIGIGLASLGVYRGARRSRAS